MSTWGEISAEAPEFAARVRRRFDAHKHKTMATLRADGSPRISGIELEFTENGEVRFGSMPDSLKGRDVLRDPRVAVHSGSEDADEEKPADWTGDAKLSGLATAAGPTDPDGPAGTMFAIDVKEAVLTYVDADAEHLVIESWHEGRGHQLRRRR
jgi:hypothetical protein